MVLFESGQVEIKRRFGREGQARKWVAV